MDIPAYNGRPSEQIRTKANPYDLNKFFDESESSIYDYPTMGKLESEVVDYATPKNGRIKPALRRRVQESVAIMKYARLVKAGRFERADRFIRDSFRGKSTEQKLSFIGSL